MPLLSFVMPVYQGSSMLDDTLKQMVAFDRDLPEGGRVEIIAVDDGSTDGSYEKILENQKRYPGKIRAVKLSRNFGAIPASLAGLSMARGDCVANIAQDLQEPLDLYLRMYQSWQKGIKVNLPYREQRDEGFLKKLLANTYHFLFRKLAVPDYPAGGLCAYLVDRQVADEFIRQKNLSDPATLIFTLGYSRELHPYHRQANKIKTNWTLAKNIKLVIDNFISFSYLPVRLISMVGILVALSSFLFAAYVFIGKFTGWYPISQPPGWATIIVLVAFLQGMGMFMLGIMGEYLWRILETTRNRPPYLIDEVSEDDEGKPTPEDADNAR